MLSRTPRIGRALLASLLLGACAASAQTQAPLPTASVQATQITAVRNPLFGGADPHIAVTDGRYWILATTAASAGEGFWKQLYAWSSKDLRTWTRSGPIFSLDDVPWLTAGPKGHGLWAPAIAQANGRYYLYYSVGPQTKTSPSRLGVAVGDRPDGPFKDIGAPLLAGSASHFEAIDPMVFFDPKTGVPYLYVGGSDGDRLRVFELEPSMTAIKREIAIEQPWYFTEAPFMHERNGIYYLSYSHGNWDRANYSVHYSTAPSPTGPWAYADLLVSSDATRKGPGHHGFVRNPATDEWFIAYHRWSRSPHGPYKGDREVAVEPVTYDAEGKIRWVVMSDAPPPRSPLPGAPPP